MDVLPIKFRSPPPKPPRRRHSDQLSISPSGTLPSCKNKYFSESQCNYDKEQAGGNTASSCGSLPANWTPDFSLEEKIEDIPVFCKEKVTYVPDKRIFQNVSTVDYNDFSKLKSSCVDDVISTESRKNSNYLWSKNSNPPYIHHIVRDPLSSKNHLKNLLEPFLNEVEKKNIAKEICNDKNSEVITVKSFFKEYHRRQNSDPLPLKFDITNSINGLNSSALIKNSFLEFSSLDTSNKLSNSSHLCESKEVHCLAEEIKSLKEINHKLWEHICYVQASLDNLKNNSIDCTKVLSVSELLSSLYSSLKAKDNAMEDRMKIILKERDDAIQDLDNMVHIVARSFEDDSIEKEGKTCDKEIKDLLQEIEVTSNPVKLLQQQRLLLAHLYRSKELRQDHILHELKLTISERNNLKERVKLLEEELGHLKLSNEIWDTDNKHWESSLLNLLCQVIQQRDMAIKNYSSQSKEYFNCRSSVHENSFDSEQINECLQRLDGTGVKKSILQSPQNIKNYSPFSLKSKSDEIRYLKEEILVLNKSLEIEMEKRESAEEKCIRLERLVNVLQKKINGQNVGIPV